MARPGQHQLRHPLPAVFSPRVRLKGDEAAPAGGQQVKNLLTPSLTNPGDDRKITELFAASVEDDRLGISVRRDGDRLEYAYPVAILAAARS